MQEEDIVKIADAAVFTSENIKGGNEEIREVKPLLTQTHYVINHILFINSK